MNLKRTGYNILKKIEKYTKTDMVYLTRGSFWMTANQAVTAIFTFFLAVAFAHLLSEETFGNYRFILSLAAIVGSFSLTGLNLAIVRDVSKNVTGLLRLGFIAQLKWSIGTLIASLGISGYYLLKDNSDLAFAALIMGIFIPIISSAHLYNSYWEGKKDYRRISLFNMITIAVYSVFLFATIHLTTRLPIIIFVYFATQALCTYIFYKWSLQFDVGNTPPEHTTLRFGKHMSLVNVLLTISGQLDRILVFYYLGAAQLAVYALSQVPIVQMRSLLRPVTQLAFPKYSATTVEEIRSSIYRKMFIFTIPIAIMVFTYIVLAPYFFQIFFPKYTEAVLYSQVAVLSLLFFQKKLIAYAILAHASQKKIYATSIFSAVFKIALLLLLLPHYGIWGAILTELIVHATGLFSSLWVLKHL